MGQDWASPPPPHPLLRLSGGRPDDAGGRRGGATAWLLMLPWKESKGSCPQLLLVFRHNPEALTFPTAAS